MTRRTFVLPSGFSVGRNDTTTVCTDVACTVAADIQTTAGAAIAGGVLTATNNGYYASGRHILGPDNVVTLYAKMTTDNLVTTLRALDEGGTEERTQAEEDAQRAVDVGTYGPTAPGMLAALEPQLLTGTLAARPAAATFGKGYYFATDDAGGVLYHSNATAWTQVSRGLAPLPLGKAGDLVIPTPIAGLHTGVDGTVTTYRIPLGRGTAFDKIGVAFTTAASAGGVIRFGVYADDSNWPNALLGDFGTIIATGLGIVDLTLGTPFVSPSDAVFVAVASQGGASTQPVMRAVSATAMPHSPMLGGMDGASYFSPQKTGVSGALPGTWPNSRGASLGTTGPAVHLRLV